MDKIRRVSLHRRVPNKKTTTALGIAMLAATLMFASVAVFMPQADAQQDRILTCPDKSSPPCNPGDRIITCPDKSAPPCNPERLD